MKLKYLIKFSINNLKTNKIRSFLTILGIIIGIASIISTLAIGYGAEEKLRKKILAMGKNYIFIHAGNGNLQGKTDLTKRKEAQKINLSDIDLLQNQCPEIKKISPVMFSRQIISTNGNNVLVDIKACNQDFIDILERKINLGNFINQQQIQKSSKVIVIGEKTAKDLFKNINPINNTVKINKILYTVIGVLKPVENYMDSIDPNLDSFIPISTGQKYLFHTTNQQIHSICISAKNMQDMGTLVRKIKNIFRFQHRLQENEPDDFTIYDQKAMINAAQSSSSTFNIFLLIIAFISLLVGGIGVMNIMLVSISERTQEFGIKLALGAPNFYIKLEVIIQTILLCFIGGILGILIGLITPYIINYFTNWTVIIKTWTILFSILITFFIGIIFGLYPAQKACKLNPVEALQDS